MLGLPKGTVQLIPYTKEWKRLFEEEKKALRKAVGPYVEDIQHVGSTSIDIPGMVAKPILDISIFIHSLALVKECVPKLEDLGYEYRGEYGIPGRHYFVKGEPRTHHIHMMLPTCANRQNQVYFRDYLLQHPERALEYARFKQEWAASCDGDREAYTSGKDPLISQILKEAKAYFDGPHSHLPVLTQIPPRPSGTE